MRIAGTKPARTSSRGPELTVGGTLTLCARHPVRGPATVRDVHGGRMGW